MLRLTAEFDSSMSESNSSMKFNVIHSIIRKINLQIGRDPEGKRTTVED